MNVPMNVPMKQMDERATLSDGVRLTALMDSCHSGTGLDLPFSWEPAGRGWGGGWREETNPYHSLGDVQMISGCEDDDVSCDAAGGGGRTSQLTQQLKRKRKRKRKNADALPRHRFEKGGNHDQCLIVCTTCVPGTL